MSNGQTTDLHTIFFFLPVLDRALPYLTVKPLLYHC